MKSRKLQKAIAAAEASMWVGINSIQLSENDCALSIALICSIVSTELSRNCKWHVVMANIYYSYPQMQWLFDVKICIVEIHTSVIILWFFYLYFMKGTKLHWNICCYKRENVDVIWIRLDTTMQCRGINRKDCSQVTDFGNFGFQSLLRRLGVLEKKLKVGSAAPRRLSIFFPKPPTSGAGFETKISKVRHLRAVFTLITEKTSGHCFRFKKGFENLK